MFETLLASIVGSSAAGTERPEGAAFLRVAKDLYRLTSLAYLAVNIPVFSRATQYAHCSHSDGGVRHCVSKDLVAVTRLRELGLTDGPLDWEPSEWEAQFGAARGNPDQRAVTFPLLSRQGENAVFGITASADPTAWHRRKSQIMHEVRILANYFHSHIMRINGHDSNAQILVSARELDCLKWTAAGKTAWEASVILGISERTVRFHLNAAREKLDCATTAQAVAKAVTQHWIEV